MSEYGKYTTQASPPQLSYCRGQARKEARKKLLAEVERRRQENYKRFYQKYSK